MLKYFISCSCKKSKKYFESKNDLDKNFYKYKDKICKCCNTKMNKAFVDLGEGTNFIEIKKKH